MRRSKLLHALLGIAISGGLIIWLLFSLNLDAVANYLLSANYWCVLPASAILIVHFMARAWRWKYLLPEGRSFGFRARFDAIQVGNFASFVLPLRAGEFVRPYLLSTQGELKFATAFASVVIERFFDLSAVLITFAIIVNYVPGMPEWAYAGAWSLGVVALGILGFVFLGVLAPQLTERLVRFVLRVFPRFLRSPIEVFVIELLEGTHTLRSLRRLSIVCLLTVIVWLLCYLYLFSFLFLFDLPASYTVAACLGVVLALAVAAPSAPGFIGVYQTGCIAGFALFGVGSEPAVAYSVITHLHQYIFFVVYGVYVLSRHGLKLSQLQKRGASAEPVS